VKVLDSETGASWLA